MGRELILLLALLSISVVRAEPTAARQSELRYLLRQDCGSCHGMWLKGGLGPSLLPSALQGKSDAFLEDTVLNGRAGTAMPPWAPLLTVDEVRWLIGELRRGPADE